MARIGPGAGFTNNHKFAFGVISAFSFLFVVSWFISQAFEKSPQPTVKSVESFFAEFKMNFQGNNGSFTQDVKYYSRGYQYDLMFMSNEVLLNLYSTDHNPPGSPNSTNNKTKLSQVSIEFVNASKSPVIKGLSEFVPTRVASASSAQNDHSKHSFSEVKYTGLYPGVDVYFSGKQKQLFYEFVLSETANVDDLVLRVNGLENNGDFTIDMHGNIVVTCRGKQMEIQKPAIYRVVNQVRKPVNGYFLVTPTNEIRFKSAESDVKLL